ncbi:unnamed protein product [Chironomus riparius]|uniref:Uncharacterized protein n=1 Tax=Chironomus riparius TaxID=315576 RepID=A0A9N9S2J4_9DIPT|nr:unnamed protein product [Chironomus riparius]
MYFVSFLIVLSIYNSEASGKFVKVENCTTTNKSLKITRCDIINGSISISIDVFRPLDKVFVKISLYKRENSYFRSVGKFPVFEACDLVQKGTKQNPFITGFTNIVLSAVPKFINGCPFSGAFDLSNFTLVGEMFRYIPKGKFVKVDNCTSTNKSLHIEQCNAINGALNVVVNIFRPLDEVFVKLSLFRREGSYFKPLGKFPILEVCDLMSGATKQNPFVMAVSNIFFFAVPSLRTKCPFLKVDNCTTTNKSLNIERCETDNGMLNIAVDIFKLVDQVFVKVALFRRESSSFRQIGKLPVVEICDMISSGLKLNPVAFAISNVFFHALPNFRKGCPFNGHVEILNFTLKNEMFKFATKGIFKVKLLFFNDVDKMIFWMDYIYAKTS